MNFSRHGRAWQGEAGLGKARHGKATRLPVGGITGYFPLAGQGRARQGKARRGWVGRGNTPTGGRYHQLFSLGAARQGTAWRGTAWRGRTRRGTTLTNERYHWTIFGQNNKAQ